MVDGSRFKAAYCSSEFQQSCVHSFFLPPLHHTMYIPAVLYLLGVHIASCSALPQVSLDFKTTELKKCPIDLPFSCTNHTVIEDTCCFEYPGGILLQTQFWDYYPPVGPNDMFTLHGLWPDNCDGQYEQFCDNSMNIRSAREILQEHNEIELLRKMEKVWKNFNGNDDSLWVHEFNKHATCLSTIKESCYLNFKKDQNVIDFFKKTVELYEELPTYEWLAENGIVPSNDQLYSKKQIEDTLSARFGQPVFIKCNKYHALQEVWYFYHLRGSVINGDYVAIPSLLNSQCPEEGIRYIPKEGFQPPTPTNTHPGSPAPTGKYIKGILKPEGQPGCIISNGNWYSSGTCAKFILTKAEFGGYNLKSSKGYCKIGNEGYLVCGRYVTPMQFAYDKQKKWITFGGKTRWSAEKVPNRFKQVSIYPGYDGPVEFHLSLEQI